MNGITNYTPRGYNPADGRLIRYTGESMAPRYRNGALLVVFPEAFVGQPLTPNAVYAVETRTQGRIYGRYLGRSSGASCRVSPEVRAILRGEAPTSPRIPASVILAPENPEYTPMDIPLYEIVEVARVVADLNVEQ